MDDYKKKVANCIIDQYKAVQTTDQKALMRIQVKKFLRYLTTLKLDNDTKKSFIDILKLFEV